MIEVEVKVLLGEKEKAEELKKKLGNSTKGSKQWNHYFNITSKDKLRTVLEPVIKEKSIFDNVLESNDISLRSRDNEKQVILVFKASIDDSTSANGRARIELEQEMNMPLKELDELLLSAGCTYQAKWSREREEFEKEGVTVTIDKNAGYGYLAEFEIMVDSPEKATEAKEKIYSLLKGLNLEELDSQRLARMFDYYNKNWEKYYGTEKTFTIE